MPLSRVTNTSVLASLKRYIEDIEDAPDLQHLDLHFHRAGAYVSAARDLGALPSEQIQALLITFDHLYRRGLARMTGEGRKPPLFGGSGFSA